MSFFDWDEANRDHIARHKVTPTEAEEVSLGFPLELDSYIIDGELRVEEVGQTSAGRILKIVSIERERKTRIVTAFDAPYNVKQLFLMSKVIQ